MSSGRLEFALKSFGEDAAFQAFQVLKTGGLFCTEGVELGEGTVEVVDDFLLFGERGDWDVKFNNFFNT